MSGNAYTWLTCQCRPPLLRCECSAPPRDIVLSASRAPSQISSQYPGAWRRTPSTLAGALRLCLRRPWRSLVEEMGCRKSVLPLPCEFPFVRQRSRANSLTSASCLNVPRGRTSQVKLFPAREPRTNGPRSLVPAVHAAVVAAVEAKFPQPRLPPSS